MTALKPFGRQPFTLRDVGFNMPTEQRDPLIRNWKRVNGFGAPVPPFNPNKQTEKNGD